MTATRGQRWIAAIRDEPPGLTALEALVLAAVAAVAAAGWLALGLAHVGQFRLATLVIGLLALAAAAGAVVWRWRPPVPRPHASDLVFVVIAALAATLFLPGAPYVAGDKDPGVYVEHAFAIAREGSNDIPDRVLVTIDDARPPATSPSAFPGLWIDPTDRDSSLPQFYHQYPALLAAARTLGGAGAVFQLNPLLGVLAVLAFALTVRRTFGLVTAAIVGLLLSTNMLQVFFAKYPSSEIPSQLLMAGVLLFLVTAVRTRWWPAAVTGGALTTLLFLAHPGGLLVIGIAVIAMAGAAAARVETELLVAWAAGLALPAAHAWYQAYRLNRIYSFANEVPRLETVVATFALIAIAGAALRRFGPGLWRRARARWPWLAAPETRRRVVGWALTVSAGAMLVFFAFREQLLGQASRVRPSGEVGRSFNEINLERLGFFFTRPGLALMGLGVAVAAFTVRRGLAWMVLLPGAALLPNLLWRARIAPRLMWWGRRFIPTAVPLIALLIAVALSWLIMRQGRHRVVGQVLGLALTVGLTSAFLIQSWPVSTHREWGGSWSFLERIDDLAGEDQAVFLWQGPTGTPNEPARNFGGPLWFVHDQLSVYLPSAEPDQAEVQEFVDAFPGQDIFVLTVDDQLPPGIDATRFEPRGRIEQTMTVWDERILRRPDRSEDLVQTVWAWQLR